jgi:hypothetical protein
VSLLAALSGLKEGWLNPDTVAVANGIDEFKLSLTKAITS